MLSTLLKRRKWRNRDREWPNFLTFHPDVTLIKWSFRKCIKAPLQFRLKIECNFNWSRNDDAESMRERGEKFIIIWRKSPPWLLSPFWTTTTPSFRVKFETHLSFRETAMPPLLKILKQLLRLLYQKCLSIARNMDPSWMNQKSFVE